MSILTRKQKAQIRKVNQQMERNERIVRDRHAGMTFAKLERKYKLTRVRCRQICKSYGAFGPNTGRRVLAGSYERLRQNPDPRGPSVLSDMQTLRVAKEALAHMYWMIHLMANGDTWIIKQVSERAADIVRAVVPWPPATGR